jgi:hypothetical protein
MILPTFVLFTSGCTTWKQADAKTLPKPPSSGTPVLSVVKTSGELIQFSKGSPGRVQGEFIAGRASNVTPAEVSIPLTEVQRIYYRRSNPTGTVLLVAGLAGATAIMAIAVANMKLDPGPILQGLKRR